MIEKYTKEQIMNDYELVVRINNREEDRIYLRFIGRNEDKVLSSNNYPIGRRLGMWCNIRYYQAIERKIIGINDLAITDKIDINVKLPNSCTK